jgi:ABC-type nitrate/sulfonate/bicarbonate transport system permease component
MTVAAERPSRVLSGLRRSAIVGGPVKRLNLSGWLVVALVAGIGELAVRVFDLEDSVAAPSDALRALGTGLWSGGLSSELATTLESYLEGLALAVAFGVVLGLVIGSSAVLLEALSPLIEFIRPIPAVAIIPLAVLFLGLDASMRRVVIAFAAFWPVLINTIYGVRGGDRLLHDVARTSGMSGPGRLVRVTLPMALPGIATGIRVSASLALLVGVTAEGVGSYMRHQREGVQLPELYAAVLLVGALGYAVNVGLRLAQRRVLFWVGEDRAGVR